jgi:hypothetical protein
MQLLVTLMYHDTRLLAGNALQHSHWLLLGRVGHHL